MLTATLVLTGCPDPNAAAPPKNATAPTLNGQASGKVGAGQASGAAQSATQTQQQAVDQLIQQVEAAYAAGLASVRQNQMEAARASFDRAMDLMLTSPLDIRGTQALSDELDKIVESVNTMEIASLEQGSALTQQTEISPAEEANDVTFPVDPNLRAEAEAEVKTTQSELPLVINDPVASFISYFTNSRAGRATLTHSLERAGRYKDLIQRILREEGVPQELIYQAVAESGFQPQVVNGHSGAGGMWQFMPGTGALYGLQRNGSVDERFDPEKATRAYARYMKDMHDQLGDWYLVMAGYDWGPGAVQKAVAKTGYADFWELYRRNNLPAETKNYVPIILAATIIAKNPAQYGFSDLHPLPSLAFDDVTTHEEIGLRLVADMTGATTDEIVTLNPGLLRMATPPGEYGLHLPPGTKELFTQRLSLVPPEHRLGWRFHTVETGESLTDIARNYRSDPAQIAEANQITGADLVEGQGLVVPVATVAAAAPSLAHAAQRYTTRKGDSLVSVADRFGVTTAELRSWNHLPASDGNTARLAAGRSLRVSSPALAHAASASRRGGHGHAVKKAAAAPPAAKGKSRPGSTTAAQKHASKPSSKTAAPSSKTAAPGGKAAAKHSTKKHS